ncbi:MAG TPA: ABC transporter permease [Sediminispirochaeta sp.]|nr:ABC transporter permease [Sediminispirochaeta sp.]
MKLTTVAFRNLWRHKTRSLLSILTIVIACILGLFMLSLVTGMKSDMKRNILSYYTGSIRIRQAQFNRYDYLNPIHLYIHDLAELQQKLTAIDGITGAVGRIQVGGKIFSDTDPVSGEASEKFNAMAMGIDFPGEKDILKPRTLLVKGQLPKMGSREILIGHGLAAKIGVDTGDKFSFMSPTAARGVNAMTFEVAGILNSPMAEFNSSYFLLPLDTMQDFVRMKDGALELLLTTPEPEEAEIQLRRVETLLAEDPTLSSLEATLWKDQGDFYGMMGISELIYNILVIFFLLLGATVIINTTMMAIYERYREIGILGAMGMKPSELVRLFFLEALFAGIISAIVGLSLGTVLVLFLEQQGLNFGHALDSMNIEISSILYPDLKLYHVILMTFYTIGISALVTLIPCRKAARIKPVDAINAT